MRRGDDDYTPTNRERSRRPRFGFFWCSGCDANLVRADERCKHCGHIEKTNRDKAGAR